MTTRRQGWALLAIGVIATLTLAALPLFVGGIVEARGWGDRELGWIASADMAGSAFACLALIRFVAHIPWRPVAWIAAGVVVAANLASASTDELISLLAVRALAGAGNGAILAIVFTGLCHSDQPERLFGLYTMGQLLTQAVLLSILPDLIAVRGIEAVFWLFASASAASAFLFAKLPAGLPAGERVAATVAKPNWIQSAALLALAAQAIYFLAPAAVWSYFESIGRGFALDSGQIGRALGLSAFAGMAGALLVVATGARRSRIACMLAGTLASVASVAILLGGHGFLPYAFAAGLFNFAWNYTFPYQMGVLATIDRDGSVAVASLIVQLAALAAGPALAATLLTGRGHAPLLWGAMACYLVSLGLFTRVRTVP